MKITQFTVGEMGVNCYVLCDEKTGEGAVVDPGRFTEEVQNEVKKLKKVKYILLTHGHFDHIWEVKKAKEITGAKVVISRQDAPCLEGDLLNLTNHIDSGLELEECPADITIDEGDELFLGEEKIQVMHTPGHSYGSVCYLMEESKAILTGDTLFCRTCGRVDFEGGEPEKMLESLKRLKNLEGDYLIYPGHNRATTLDEERIKNRYLKRDLDKWYW